MNGNRRAFLKSSSLAMVAFGLAPQALVRAAQLGNGSATRRRKTLVVVLQRGACDGLNTVIPYGDGSYRSLRPTIAIPAPNGGKDAALDLDGFFGLHPSLEPLVPLWKDGRLAAVHAVGSPDNTRSHFDAQDFMESGTPGRKATEDGWMNRSLVASPRPDATPFRAVAMTPTLPRILTGHAAAVSMANIRDFAIKGSGAVQAQHGFEQMYAGAVHDSLHGTGSETFEALDFLGRADPGRGVPAEGALYPRAGLGNSLRQVAQLIKADLGVELAFADVGGWDHHAGEGGVEGQLANRLRELGQALSAFAIDLGPRLDDVVLVTLTEFGRTARENGNRGTDHGHASVALVLGGGVNGRKVHGKWPGLGTNDLYEGRDLALTTDFRDLLSELLARHLALGDLSAVFPGYKVERARFPNVLRA